MASEVIIRKLCDHHLRDLEMKVEAVHTSIIAIGGTRRQLELCEDCWLTLVTPLHDALTRYGQTPMEGSDEGEREYPCLIPDCVRANKPYRSSSGLRAHMMARHGSTGAQERPRQQQSTLVCTLPDCDHPEPFTGNAGLASHQRSHRARLVEVS